MISSFFAELSASLLVSYYVTKIECFTFREVMALFYIVQRRDFALYACSGRCTKNEARYWKNMGN